jgi:hypothetical protein
MQKTANNIYKRALADLIIVVLALMFPWWASFAAALIALWFFSSYVEIIFLGLILDSLYNAPIASVREFQFIITIAAIVIYLLAGYIKGRLRR